MTTFEVLDPTHETEAEAQAEAPRLDTLAGKTVGFISNGKQGVREFLDALERELRDRYGVAEVVRTVKHNYSAPAEPEIIDRAKQWHALVAAVGD
jgi:hypothetical protein